MDPNGNPEVEPSRKRTRKSRFDDASPAVPPTGQLEPVTDAALLAAAELSKKIMNEKIMQENAMKAAAMQSQLASQIASISTILKTVQTNVQQTKEKKPQYHALRLDNLGREIDEHGNLVKQEIAPVKTLALNNAVVTAKRKKENPYLAHRAPPAVLPASVPGHLPGTTSAVPASISNASGATAAGEIPSLSGQSAAMSAPDTMSISVDPGISSEPVEVIDDRITATNRDRRRKKALRFVEPGKYVQLAEDLQRKEERKIIAGYASGRKSLQVTSSGTDGVIDKKEGEDSDSDDSEEDEENIPPPIDEGVVPAMEWWDEAFLPKSVRDNRKISRAAAEQDEFAQLLLQYGKSYKYVQHPVAIKALGGERAEAPLPMYLTKKERKRIRKQARAEREREKRDKMMMGLIPAPEPKFKLSNFMKVIGDQAVADPSKVEQKVMQQMRQRMMNHEMRNLAAKLTPAERKQKTLRKLQEDTTRQVHVAVFRVGNFSNPKHRFKVDVNAQQHFLSGLVVLNQEEKEKCNVIIVEGGPKGVRKMVKLMTSRIKWEEMVALSRANGGSDGSAIPQGYELSELEGGHDNSGQGAGYSHSISNDQSHSAAVSGGGSGNHDNDDDDEDNDDDEIDHVDHGHASGHGGSHSGADGEPIRLLGNKCMLVWQGVVPKRTFTGFKFQEARNAAASRKLFDAKNVAHYWDMASNNTTF